MYKTKHLGLNITEMPKDANTAFNFKQDLGDNFEAIDEETLTHRNITNCILEVPQDIKVECSDGILTVKAGSKIWVPFGTKNIYKIGDLDQFGNTVVDVSFQNNKFFYAFKLNEDKSHSQENPDAISRICWFNLADNVPNALQAHSSGVEGYTGTYNQFYYFTDTNFTKMYLEGVQSEKIMSLPICLIMGDGVNMYASVERIFNGFGYIGSTIFALPGVKCLIPNGRNIDGSLKNIVHILDTVQYYNITEEFVDVNAPIVLTPTHIGYFKSNRTLYYGERPINPYHHTRWYDSKNNYWWEYSNENGWLIEFYCVIGGININNTKINSFIQRNSFQAVDYNDYQTKITELETKIEALQTAIQALQG